MNKAFKLCAIAGGVLLTAGIVVSLVSMEVNGAQGVLRELSGETGGGGPVASFALSDADQKLAQEAASLDLSFPVADLTVEPGERFSVELGPKLRKVARLEIKNRTVRLWDPSKWPSTISRGGSVNSSDWAVRVTVPERAYEDITLSVGAGEARIAGLTADSMTADFGAGEMELSGITLREAEFSGGAGEIAAKGLTVTESFIFDAGVGESRIEGDLTGGIEISGGVGETALALSRPRSEYNIDAASGIGSVRIDGESHGMLGGDFEENNGAGNDIDISCGVGEISVTFGG